MRIIRIANEVTDPEADMFLKWFSGSKIVDKNGEPLEVYHGTPRQFEKFELSGYGNYGTGIYLTADPYMARQYASGKDGKIMATYVKMLNPYFVKSKEDKRRLMDLTKAKQISPRDLLAKQGYDGIVDNVMFSEYGTMFVAFLPSQVKIVPKQKNKDEYSYEGPEHPLARRKRGLPPKDTLKDYESFGHDQEADLDSF